MTSSRRLVAVLWRRAWAALRARVDGPARAALHDPIWGLDAGIYVCAVAWLLTLAFIRPEAFSHIRFGHLFAQKAAWTGPAIAGVIVPWVGWRAPRRWAVVRRLARAYKVAFWAAVAVLTFLLAPTFVWFWLLSLACVVGEAWIAMREAANEVRPARPD